MPLNFKINTNNACMGRSMVSEEEQLTCANEDGIDCHVVDGHEASRNQEGDDYQKLGGGEE
jgi:hypothetical protein